MNSILLVSPHLDALAKWQQLLALNYQVSQNTLLLPDAQLKQFALIILDAQMIDNHTLETTRIKQYSSKFLIVGNEWSEEWQVQALVDGAAGYCDITAPASVILKATESIVQGDIWIQRHLVHKVIGSLVKITTTQKAESPVATINIDTLMSLSSRELEVAYLIRQGTCNKIIANTLFISERTVKAHLSSIFKKLNVPDRLHLGLLLKDVAEDIFQSPRNN